MILITERPSLNKLKMFFCNGDCNQFITNLKINRQIPDEDINVYKVTDGTKFIVDNYKYTIVNGQISILKDVETEVQYSKYIHWSSMTQEQIESVYTQDEQSKIAFLITKYTSGLIASMFAGNVPFPSDFSVFDGVYVDIPPKPIMLTATETQQVVCQVINVEAL